LRSDVATWASTRRFQQSATWTRPYARRCSRRGKLVLKARLKTRTLLLLGASVIGTIAVIASRSRAQPGGKTRVPEPVKSVDLDRYLGLWYEIARYEASFERGCEAVTAEYTLRPDGLIRVLNACRDRNPSGRLRSSEGKAKIVPGSGNA